MDIALWMFVPLWLHMEELCNPRVCFQAGHVLEQGSCCLALSHWHASYHEAPCATACCQGQAEGPWQALGLICPPCTLYPEP